MRTKRRAAFFSLMIASLVVPPHVEASDDTIGPHGIFSAGLTLPDGTTLTGAGIGIGQVEGHRPGDPTHPNGMPFDTDADLLNSFVDPQEVFFTQVDDPFNPTTVTSFSPSANGITMPPNPNNFEINDHAIQVASVMISAETQPAGTPSTAGVATGANLYSSGFITGSNQPVEAVTAQNIALANSGEIRAINFSFGSLLDDDDIAEGNSVLTQFLDWSAKRHNTLYVVAGTQLDEEGNPSVLPVPTDNFNGMTIGKSERNPTSGDYDRVSDGNDFSHLSTERAHIDLIAPGVGVLVGSGTEPTILEDGTSFAAPHVTGTVALLQQYGDFQIAAGATNWDGMATSAPEPSPTARRHEVMKAVLMNSADKLIDNGTVLHPTTGQPIPEGSLLGMERTVLKQNGSDNWFDSEAYLEFDTQEFDTPLDEEMGTGHLNAKRALQQFIPGEHELNGNFGTPIVGDVPQIGWDYGTISGANYPINKYKIEGTLQAGDFFSATMAWDREVQLNDGNGNGEFDVDDTFEEYTDIDEVLTNLDLYLVPAGTNDVGEDDILVSQSLVSPVEHFFGEIPFTGEFELWVYRNEQFAPDQDYGLAWWYGLAPDLPSPTLSGDFNGDGSVDGADLAQWKGDYGLNGDSDANSDGVTDGLDFLAWQRNAVATASAQGPGGGTTFESEITTIHEQTGGEGLLSTVTASFDVTSRAVTQAEIQDAGGSLDASDHVHDFLVTTDADILAIAVDSIQTEDGEIFQHVYGSDTAEPDPALIAYFAALAADSFVATPGSTGVLGGGFEAVSGEGDVAWFDLDNDGAVQDFLFARLTTEGGIIEGRLALRGLNGPETFPFSFTFGSYSSLTPIPEPSSWLLAFVSLACAIGRRKFFGPRSLFRSTSPFVGDTFVGNTLPLREK